MSVSRFTRSFCSSISFGVVLCLSLLLTVSGDSVLFRSSEYSTGALGYGYLLDSLDFWIILINKILSPYQSFFSADFTPYAQSYWLSFHIVKTSFDYLQRRMELCRASEWKRWCTVFIKRIHSFCSSRCDLNILKLFILPLQRRLRCTARGCYLQSRWFIMVSLMW